MNELNQKKKTIARLLIKWNDNLDVAPEELGVKSLCYDGMSSLINLNKINDRMVDDYKKRYERSLNEIEKYEDNYTIEDNNNNDVEAVEVKESINQTNNSYESEEFIEDWPQLEVSEKSENIKTKFNKSDNVGDKTEEQKDGKTNSIKQDSNPPIIITDSNNKTLTDNKSIVEDLPDTNNFLSQFNSQKNSSHQNSNENYVNIQSIGKITIHNSKVSFESDNKKTVQLKPLKESQTINKSLKTSLILSQTKDIVFNTNDNLIYQDYEQYAFSSMKNNIAPVSIKNLNQIKNNEQKKAYLITKKFTHYLKQKDLNDDQYKIIFKWESSQYNFNIFFVYIKQNELNTPFSFIQIRVYCKENLKLYYQNISKKILFKKGAIPDMNITGNQLSQYKESIQNVIEDLFHYSNK